MIMTDNAFNQKTGVQIAKKARDVHTFARPALSFPDARTAFLAFMQELDLSQDDEILLPAYIGWSSREGSGVFDPVEVIGARFRFYRVTRELAIDVDDVCYKLSSGRVRLLVVIHFFGYPDRNLPKVVACAHEQGAFVLEDEAHALYSDWIGGICGRFGNAAIMSIHKMLPCDSGGLLILNRLSSKRLKALANSSLRAPLQCNPLDYDLAAISVERRNNALHLIQLLKPLRGKANLLYRSLPKGVIPQSLPILISDESRDDLYFKLNDSGFGVVSLYHTLIDSIRESEFPDSHWLSRRILNLPVHQDAHLVKFGELVAQLAGLL